MQPLCGSGQVYLTCGFDPDGRLFAAGGIGPVVDLWDTADPGAAPRQLGMCGSPFVHLALVGGRLLGVTMEAGVRLVTTDTDVVLLTGDPIPRADRGAVSADGTRVVTAGEQLILWEVGKRIRPEWSDGIAGPGPRYPRYAGVAFNPTGARVAASRVSVWARGSPGAGQYGVEIREAGGRDAVGGRVLRELPVRGRPDRLSWSPDGALLAGLVDKHLTVWEAATWSEVFGPPAGAGPGEWLSVVFHPGGRLLLTGGAAGTVGVWDVASWSPVSTFRWGTGPVYALAVAPDGLRAAAAGHGGAVIWDLDA